MAARLSMGLTPAETAFLCEMEQVTIVPRQRLEGLQLLGGPTPPLIPPQRANLPLWFALLLRKQYRANIVAPPWLNIASLISILEYEKTSEGFSPSPPLPSSNATASVPISPPFLPTSVSTTQTRDSVAADRLPFHWLEMSYMLLQEAGDDIPQSSQITTLIRDLREVRSAKIRAGVTVLEGGREVGMTGVGGLEVSESRGFVSGVVDELRGLGMSREVERREREEEGEEGEGSEMSE